MTAKKYTQVEIETINRTYTAINGSIYKDVQGNSYLGTITGTLRFVQNAAQTSITPIDNIESSNVQGALEELNTRTRSVEIDYITEAELTAASKEAKCFSVAMSIVL